jgi:hypothetical protein
MNERIQELMNGLEPAAAQRHGNLLVIPLRHRAPAGPAYVGLRQALAAKTLRIVEKDGGGSVPELVVVNNGKTGVLILDGEEVRGAKQNRVLNTTIMVKPGESILVPVSCVEAGRWRSVSGCFEDSDQILSASARTGKCERVTENLRHYGRYDGDQDAVWRDVGLLLEDAGADSPTSAMSDAFLQQSDQLDVYQKAFPLLEGQAGLIVVSNGCVASLDVLSRPEVYADLHGKLVRSHAVEARPVMGLGISLLFDKIDSEALVSAFLDDARHGKEEIFASRGAGQDHRLRGIDTAGSALVVDEAAVHLALFPRSSLRGEPKRPGPYDGMIVEERSEPYRFD